MLLRDVLLITLPIVLLVLATVLLHAQGSPAANLAKTVPVWTSALLAAVAVGVFMVRNADFGADSQAYSAYFTLYCRGGISGEENLSLEATMALLNAGMMGACRVDWLTGTWVLLFILPMLLMREPLRFRLAFIVLILFSFIGVEFTTNALRQGISIAIACLGVSLFRSRQFMLAGPVLAAASVLHPSTLLVLAMLAASLFRWRYLLVIQALAIGIVWHYVQTEEVLSFLEPLLYEIQKYLGHDDEEIWVRILAVSSLFSILSMVLISSRRKILCAAAEPQYVLALKLSTWVLPFLSIPYFGYRVTYGVYPLVLYFVLSAAEADSWVQRHFFSAMLLVNIIVLLVWSSMSTVMQLTRFL
jgi:hypothetical protein